MTFGAILLIAGSTFTLAAKTAKPPKPAAGAVVIEGEIRTEDGKPAHGAVLSAVHLESSKVFKAEPASSSGSFRLEGVPYGYYQITVAEGETLHAVAVPVNVAPSSRQKVEIVLIAARPVSESGSDPSVDVPVLGQAATAGARIQGLDRKSFLKTKAGVATLIGGSAAMLLLATH